MTDMYTFEFEYLDLVDKLLKRGEDRPDRTGVGVRGLFGEKLEIDLRQGFPLMTAKAMPFMAVLTELLWFIEGTGDERRLAEILHGSRDPDKKTIWSPNADGTTGSAYTPKYKGDLGEIYGVQWRAWKKLTVRSYEDILECETHNVFFGAKVLSETIDQLGAIVKLLRDSPYDRRILMSAWNPAALDQMALPPCHVLSQFYVNNANEISCQMYQRSVDVFLGLPFNIASYALLTHMLAHVTGRKVGKLHMVLGDTHLYLNHLDQAKEHLSREPSQTLPTLKIKRDVREITEFNKADFVLENYAPQPAIRAPMAA